MPASKVMSKFRRGKLYSGSKRGKIVRSKKQAKAIMLSEARKEGYDIPKPGGRKLRRLKR